VKLLLLRSSVAATALILATGVSCEDSSGPAPSTPVTTDRIAPQPVSDLALTYVDATHDVEFSWTAPRDDDAHDRVAKYDLRYSYSFPLDWDRSVQVPDPPTPLTVGTPQSFVLVDPTRGRDLYAAARTIDDAGNVSTIGPVVHIRVPGLTFGLTCTNAVTGSPVEGLDVLVTSRTLRHDSTDANGQMSAGDLGSGTLGVRIQTGAASIPFHTFETTFPMSTDSTIQVPMIPFVATDSPLFDSTLDLVLAALIKAGSTPILKKWFSYPIPYYPPDFVNTLGVDYGALARQAAAQWNARTGLTIFTEVASPPATGVVMNFLPRAQMGGQNGITLYTNDANGYPAQDNIRIVDDFSDSAKLYTIMMHELGHTIRLGHLPAGFIMYAGQPLPNDITDDEVRLVQLMLALPNGIDLTPYDPSAPTP
jgi:hypothetical protein